MEASHFISERWDARMVLQVFAFQIFEAQDRVHLFSRRATEFLGLLKQKGYTLGFRTKQEKNAAFLNFLGGGLYLLCCNG